jgi:hypothetical protein
MILNRYDSSSFNAVQESKQFMDYFHNPVCGASPYTLASINLVQSPSVIRSVNTASTVAGIMVGKLSDRSLVLWR